MCVLTSWDSDWFWYIQSQTRQYNVTPRSSDTKKIIPCFVCSLLLFTRKPIILCKIYGSTRILLWSSRAGRESVEERANPITTLAESTLCSKIETHRRQIKTRKRNLTRNHAQTDCYAGLGVWVNIVGFPKLKRFSWHRGDRWFGAPVLVGSAHSRHTFNRFPSTPRLPRHSSYTAFISRFPQLLHFGSEHTARFSTAIFQAFLLSRGSSFCARQKILSALILQSVITNGRFLSSSLDH